MLLFIYATAIPSLSVTSLWRHHLRYDVITLTSCSMIPVWVIFSEHLHFHTSRRGERDTHAFDWSANQNWTDKPSRISSSHKHVILSRISDHVTSFEDGWVISDPIMTSSPTDWPKNRIISNCKAHNQLQLKKLNNKTLQNSKRHKVERFALSMHLSSGKLWMIRLGSSWDLNVWQKLFLHKDVFISYWENYIRSG